jgi:hypothetical protein
MFGTKGFVAVVVVVVMSLLWLINSKHIFEMHETIYCFRIKQGMMASSKL